MVFSCQGLSTALKPVSIAVDSTGICVHKAGGWIERKHGKREEALKVLFEVNKKLSSYEKLSEDSG
jgi:hypothetical protein